MSKRVIDLQPVLLIFLLLVGFGLSIPDRAVGQIPERSLQDPPGTEYVRLGGTDGWGEFERKDQVDLVPGWRGGDEIVISDSENVQAFTEDLYAPFDTGTRDFVGRYRSGPRHEIRHITHLRRFGEGAIAFDGTGALSLIPEVGSVFTPYAHTGSFVIDFWLYPTGIDENVEVLRWNGAFLGDIGADGIANPVLQEIRFYIQNGKFRWELRNLVSKVDLLAASGGIEPHRAMTDISLEARRGPVPRRWTHHRLRYDAERGQLSYLVDDRPESIAYLTSTGRENGEHYGIIFGDDTGTGIVIGDGYRGLIDELLISRDASRGVRSARYESIGGTVITRPIVLPPHGGEISAIRTRAERPEHTEIDIFYRVIQNGSIEVWRRLPEDGEFPEAIRAESIQLKVELLTNASGTESPRLQGVSIAYQPFSPPPTPVAIRGESIPGGVAILWDPVFDAEVVGYRLLFGERPGRYIGTTDITSPIDVGNRTRVEIHGLEARRSYVFAVESIDAVGQRSALSREIEVRAGEME